MEVRHTSRRAKGNSFEYDCEASLKQVFPHIRVTERRGFARGFDLISDEEKMVVECKNHASFSWNELVRLHQKLEKNAPDGYTTYLIFHANRSPVLVMLSGEISPEHVVCTFQCLFSKPWVKHEPVKRKGGVER